MERVRVQFVAGEFLKMTNLLEGLMQNTRFSLYSLHWGTSYLLYLPFPPKLLRSPTFQRETVGQSVDARGNACRNQWFYVHLSQIFLFGKKKYAQPDCHKFKIIIMLAFVYSYSWWILMFSSSCIFFFLSLGSYENVRKQWLWKTVSY